MAFDTKKMNVDYRALRRMTPSERTGYAKRGLLDDVLSSLTPTQVAQLFPKYYAEQLPNIGISGSEAASQIGTSGSFGGGGGGFSGGGGDDSGGSTATATPQKTVESQGPLRPGEQRKTTQRPLSPAELQELNKKLGNTAGTQKLLGLIASGEGGYNSSNRGTINDRIVGSTHNTQRGGKALPDLTIGEIMNYQKIKDPNNPNRLFAVGKYQLIPDTFKAAVQFLGLKPDQKLTPEIQEKMGMYLVMEKRPAVGAYIRGESNDLLAAQKALALEFASMPVPVDMTVEGKFRPAGASAYGNGNRAGHSIQEVQQVLEQSRQEFAQAQQTAQPGMGPDASSVNPNSPEMTTAEPLPNQPNNSGSNPSSDVFINGSAEPAAVAQNVDVSDAAYTGQTPYISGNDFAVPVYLEGSDGRPFDEDVKGMDPDAVEQLKASAVAAKAAGLTRLVVTGAKSTKGHKSHAGGTEFDFKGYTENGEVWSPDQRAIVSYGASEKGADRIGFYSGDGRSGIHIGSEAGQHEHADEIHAAGRRVAGAGAWGVDGRTSGVSSSEFITPLERQMAAWAKGEAPKPEMPEVLRKHLDAFEQAKQSEAVAQNTQQPETEPAPSAGDQTAVPAEAPQRVFIGDSIAQGMRDAARGEGNTKVGRKPSEILSEMETMGADYFRGKEVVLSSGLSNNTQDLDSVRKQMEFLKQAGATVRVAGMSNSREDLAPGNQQLQDLANEYGYTFMGGFDAGKDKIHPQNYGDYLTHATPAPEPAPETAAPETAAPETAAPAAAPELTPETSPGLQGALPNQPETPEQDAEVHTAGINNKDMGDVKGLVPTDPTQTGEAVEPVKIMSDKGLVGSMRPDEGIKQEDNGNISITPQTKMNADQQVPQNAAKMDGRSQMHLPTRDISLSPEQRNMSDPHTTPSFQRAIGRAVGDNLRSHFGIKA